MEIFLWLFLLNFSQLFIESLLTFGLIMGEKFESYLIHIKSVLSPRPDNTTCIHPAASRQHFILNQEKDQISSREITDIMECSAPGAQFKFPFNLNSSLLFPKEQFLNTETNNYRGVRQ